MFQSNNQFGINIHLLSFTLPKDLFKDNDEIRVSVTTFPEEKKQHFCIKGSKIHCSNHVFMLNISKETKKILMVFRRKSFMQSDPIIAKAIINSFDLPKIPSNIEAYNMEAISTDIKTISIFEKRQKNELNDIKQIGEMKVQMSLTSPYQEEKIDHKNNRLNNNVGNMNSLKIQTYKNSKYQCITDN